MLSNELFTSSPDFIKENSSLKMIRHERGGKYSKKERNLRRKEVYRLHFEYGYCATKIADMTKFNRHTIEDDIKYWYSKLEKQWDDSGLDSKLQKQFIRIESQRTRLAEDLEKYKDDLEKRLVIEKMMMEVDSRLTKFILNVYQAQDTMISDAIDYFNKKAKEQNLDWRLHNLSDAYRISKNKSDAIAKILSGK